MIFYSTLRTFRQFMTVACQISSWNENNKLVVFVLNTDLLLLLINIINKSAQNAWHIYE